MQRQEIEFPDGVAEWRKMLRQTFTDRQIELLIRYGGQNDTFYPSLIICILLLVYAGLRAAEVVSLSVDAFLNSLGMVGDEIEISPGIKNGRGRMIPMHPLIKSAVVEFIQRNPDAKYVAVAGSSRAGHPKRWSPNTFAVWFRRACLDLGFQACSSHSGRRTFATSLLRRANEVGCSIVDVQRFLGHARMDTTARYIAPSERGADLIRLQGGAKAELFNAPTQKIERPQINTNERSRNNVRKTSSSSLDEFMKSLPSQEEY